MKTRFFRFALVVLTLAPGLASADVLLSNKDGTRYELAVRYRVATSTVKLPANTHMVVTAGALSIQLRDSRGNPRGKPVEVVDGDRLFVKNGRLQKQPARD